MSTQSWDRLLKYLAKLSAYDAENRITTAGSTTYTYDADGRRVKKSSGTNYWYGPTGAALAETDGSGNWTNYIFFGGERLARNVSGDIKYYVTDHLHSTAVFADKSGAVLDDNDFYPWGGVIPGIGQTTSNNTVKFTGQYRDAESNLDYFGARYYANATGRFMTPDWDGKPTTVPYAEFGDPQSLNLYAFARNSPIVRVDADGHNINTYENLGFQSDDFFSPGGGLGNGLDDDKPKNKPQQQQAQNHSASPCQSGACNILGQTVPYTTSSLMTQQQSTAAVDKLQKIVATINAAEDQLTSTQVTEIKAVKTIYIAASLSDSNAAGMSVTNVAVQNVVAHDENIHVPIGTYIINGANLSTASIGYWASTFVHEGVHIIHHDIETPANERRAYFEQYKSLPPFHVTFGEGALIKDFCGANCY